MAFEHTVHDTELTPYAPGAGPSFHLRTWYAGVAVQPSGQSQARLGYCLTMAGEVVIETPVGQEDYLPSPLQPFESDAAQAFLLGYLTNDFLVADLLAEADAPRKPLLEAYQSHLGPLWDYAVTRFGEAACYGL